MISQRTLRCAVVAGACLVGFPFSAWGQQPLGSTELGWIGLYSVALVEWLENENRVNDLCSHATVGTSPWRECREETLRPRQHVLRLRNAPTASGTSAGSIVVQAVPGRGLRAFYRAAAGEPATELVPDLFDADWGYGPYFHQTFLERRGMWFLLPAGPFPAPTWIDIGEFGDGPHVRLVQKGDIIRTQKGDLVVLGVERGVLRGRPEQAADMWCKEGNPPPPRPSKEILIPVEELYSPTGHLLVGIKYRRGC